jgi:hypothetical protein
MQQRRLKAAPERNKKSGGFGVAARIIVYILL